MARGLLFDLYKVLPEVIYNVPKVAFKILYIISVGFVNHPLTAMSHETDQT